MVEPISTGAAIVAASAWFANKLLGPSADALGDQIKLYASDRLTKILTTAEELSDGLDIKPLPPGFALEVVQKASLSEDDENLTTMWAKLIVEASIGFNNRHMLFASIISQIGGAEASYLAKFTPSEAVKFYDTQRDGRRNFQSKIDDIYEVTPNNYDQAWSVIRKIMDMRPPFLGSLCSVSIGYTSDMVTASWTGASRAGNDHIEVLDALARQRLIEFVTYRPHRGMFLDRIEAAEVTALGNRLLLTCNPTTGEK